MKYCVAIDLGGTGIKGALVSEEGEILKTRTIPTAKEKNEVLRVIGEVVEELKTGYEIEGIGLGSPGTIDSENGKVLGVGGNINDWAYTDIKGYLDGIFPGTLIKVDNDANCAGQCEVWMGAARGYKSALILTLGTGLGGAVFVHGKMLHGERFKATELGHLILYPRGRECMCGQRGCSEKYVCGTGIELNYEELTGKTTSAVEIVGMVDTDVNAKRAVDKFAEDLGYVLINMKNAFDPAVIVIGGGVINSADIWWDKMLANYKKYVNSYDDMPIVKAQYLNSAGLIGAASLIFDSHE